MEGVDCGAEEEMNKEEVLELAVRIESGSSASPQDIVDQDTQMWQWIYIYVCKYEAVPTCAPQW